MPGFHGGDIVVVKNHVLACSSESSSKSVKEFGIDTENCFFRFWYWVGERYSVCGAAGAVPISLFYGVGLFEKILEVSNYLGMVQIVFGFYFTPLMSCQF